MLYAVWDWVIYFDQHIFVWIVEATFVIVSGSKDAPSVFGWAQLFVFGSFGVVSQIANF